MGQKEFEDYEVVNGPVIPPEIIVRWCLERMFEYDVRAIVMDTYRYTLLKMKFEEEGLIEYSKQQPYGQIRLIRKIASVCGIIAPEIEKLFAIGSINFGLSAIMRWYTNNTEVKTDKYGNKQYAKIEPKLRKNDGFMAFVAAMFFKDLIKEKVIYV